MLAGRETLRNTEQSTMLDAATAYMNVLRDTAILDLQRRNVQVLQEQLKQTRDRFNVGEVTRTDVAQSESRLAAAQSQVLSAEANLKSSQAVYRRVIGTEPVNLRPAMPVDRLSPAHAARRDRLGLADAPDCRRGAVHSGCSADGGESGRGYALSDRHAGKLGAAPLGRAARRVRPDDRHGARPRAGADLSGRRGVLDHPPEQGNARPAPHRARRAARHRSAPTVVQAWAQVEATKAQIIAAQAQVTATEVALNGVREEARVGQRTTLDVLNAQQELVNARVSLVTAQRDRVVASYTLLSAVGRLSPQVLGLATDLYDPRVHYHQVRDKWIGVRTPDGR